MFVAAACVAYYGAFTSLYREKVRQSTDSKMFSLVLSSNSRSNFILLSFVCLVDGEVDSSLSGAGGTSI